ncbi:MAG: hypothetical protein MRY64_11940 [Hyphomonadaceae bacterium]|nr:hypothetical protein [Hyphomonadaceae bacterium]
MFRISLAAVSLAVLAACASTTTETDPADAIAPPVEAADIADSPFALAMNTVESLAGSGNEQAAIDRLTQLLGDPNLTPEQYQTALETRAALRYGEGDDVWGAISDYETLLEMDGLSADQIAAYEEALNTARGEATSTNFMLEQGELSRTERFELMFRLGEHQEAVDYMLENNLTPSNAHLVDLYQMGYLCEGDEYGGPVYAATEPDGTPRSLQYCDFGK